MLLGMVLLAGVRMIATFAGTAKDMQELLICMITYSLLASLLVTNLLSMVTTRYTADMLYMNKDDRIMPSFYGSTALMYVIGGLGYGIFLLFSGIEPVHQLCCFILFMELIVVWQEINYLTAVKDYKGILLTFPGLLTTTLDVVVTPLPVVVTTLLVVVFSSLGSVVLFVVLSPLL